MYYQSGKLNPVRFNLIPLLQFGYTDHEGVLVMFDIIKN